MENGKKMMKYNTTILIIALVISILTSCTESQISSSESYSYADGSGTQGQGGSMARFAIKENVLYAVNSTSMKIFDISDPANLQSKGTFNLSWGVETIFPYDKYLFIGTMSGMHILDISTPLSPTYAGQYEHIVSCDPVVVNGKYAYITLHAEGSWCGRNTNELQIIDIENVLEKNSNNASLLNSIPMSKPLGLGVTNDYLFVCDGALKVFDRSDPVNLKQIHTFNIPDPYDVIPYNNTLMVISPAGYYQYQFTSDTIFYLSHIPIHQQN